MQARTLVAYAMVLVAIVAQAASANAEVRVEGSASSLHVNARNATPAEIIAALAERFDLRVRGTAGNRRINEDFDGTLRRVIARVLAGYNYAIWTRDGRLEVFVLNTSSPHAVPAPVYAPPTYPAAKLRRDE